MQNQQISLKEILSQLSLETYMIAEDIFIRGVVADSRAVHPGDLFVAITGTTIDGHQFISNAEAAGAAAVVGTQDITHLKIPYIRVENSKRMLGQLAAAYYGFPAKKLGVIGVTGTDGKTTTINLIYGILRAAGIRVGMISTVNAVIGDQSVDTGFHVTTPDAPDIQRYLANMVDAGMSHVILETTSHGLAQYRVEACEFDIGVVTNITHEHLDFHGTYENYRAAKAKLFDYLESTVNKHVVQSRAAVLNHDDSSYQFLAERTNVHKISYGFHHQADVRAENVTQDPGGWAFDVLIQDKRYKLETNLVGFYNISNCLAARKP